MFSRVRTHNIKYRKLITLFISLLLPFMASTAFAAKINKANIVKFTNNTPFTLTLNVNSDSSTAYMVDKNGVKTFVTRDILPKQSRYIYIAANNGFNLNYQLDAPTVNNYNLNIQNQNGQFSISATDVPDATTTISGQQIVFQQSQKSFPTDVQYPSMPFRGVNLSGAEAGSGYVASYLPTIEDMVYYMKEGMNTVRLPISWDYISSQADGGTINYNYLDSIYDAVKEQLQAGNNVIIDLHNYMRYQYNGQAGNGAIVNTQDMTFIWQTLAKRFKNLAIQYPSSGHQNQLMFELMNEPNNMATATVLANENAGIAAIRAEGLSNLILLDGNSWTGLHSWLQTTGDETDGISNAAEFVPSNIQDSDHNYAIAVHEYFDSNESGNSSTCQPLNNLQTALNMSGFINWMKTNKVPVIVTEMGSGPVTSSDTNCEQDVNWFLTQLESNPYSKGNGGFLGWTAWVGGHGWSMSNFNNLSPTVNSNGQLQETSQMADIYENKHLS